MSCGCGEEVESVLGVRAITVAVLITHLLRVPPHTRVFFREDDSDTPKPVLCGGLFIYGSDEAGPQTLLLLSSKSMDDMPEEDECDE